MKFLHNNLDETLAKYANFLSALNVSKASQKFYLSDAHQFLAFYEVKTIKDLSNFKTDDLNKYLTKLKVMQKSNATLKRKKSSLKNFFDFLMLSGISKYETSDDKNLKLNNSYVTIPKVHFFTAFYLLVFTIVNVYFFWANRQSSNFLAQANSFPPLGVQTGVPAKMTDNFINTTPSYIKARTFDENSQGFTISVNQDTSPFGQVNISAGQTDVVVYSDQINSSSLLFVTPVSEISSTNKYYIKSQGEGFFTIRLTEKEARTTVFNWLVQNITTQTIY